MGGRVLAIPIVRSAKRRRTLAITVDQGGGVRVLVPLATPRSEVEALVFRQSAWIVERLSRREVAADSPETDAPPASVPYRGQLVPLVIRPGRYLQRARFEGETLVVVAPATVAPADAARASVEAFYRLETERLVTAAITQWAPVVGREPSRVLVRTQKRRWGSCAADGSLRFNLRLAMVDPELLEYVVVHELCHLLKPDHLPAFWAEVERVLPDQVSRRSRLRAFERSTPRW